MSIGKFYLIPVPLGPSSPSDVLPGPALDVARRLQHFVAENAKSARAFLKAVRSDTPLQQIDIRELNEHTQRDDLPGLLAPLLAGHDVGLISEAGCPAVADPGAALVALAHEAGIAVHPLIGPSSILLALMGSGLSGQSFAFHGYLPAKDDLRRKSILDLERDSRRESRTQLFIETPYRNLKMLQALLDACSPGTRIAIATDLTLESQRIMTMRCSEWKRQALPDIDKRPTVFLIQA